MIMRILSACIVAGLVAGLATAALQHFTTTPLILAAEVFETGGDHHAAAAPSTVAGTDLPHAHAAPADAGHAGGPGLERSALTAVSTIATATGFALMLLAAMILAGTAITPRTGLAWGATAFVAAALAPALGLSPELPGAAAGDLADRQIWWIGTVAATAAGLWLVLRVSTPLAIAGGLALVALPHVIGAPHPPAFASPVPAELAGHFAAASLVVQAVVWAMVGSIAGYMWHRGDRRSVA